MKKNLITRYYLRKLAFLCLSLALTVQQNALGATAANIVELQTNLGTITLQLNRAKAPITVKNFISYAESGFYKNTLIHRVVKNFVIQGGGVDKVAGVFKKTNPPIKNEANNGLHNLKGSIAMARTNQPNSATSQFFINLKDNTGLDYNVDPKNPAGYTVFGKVIKGMAVVERIGKLQSVSELPFINLYENVLIDNVYTSTSLNNKIGITRMMATEGGKITSTPAGINCGAQCTLQHPIGSALKVTAIPAKGFYFTGWRGDCQGTTATIAINTKKGNQNCKALFAKAASSG